MDALRLFYDTVEEALRAVVDACGGPKVVGCKLWPDKTPDGARRYLLDCLNENRSERLTPAQLILLLRMGRDAGCDVAMHFIERTCGYADSQPIDPEDERARLMRDFIEAQRQLEVLAKQMARAGVPGIVRAA